ncbi:hypothetical protein PHJA_000823700 [Phtheirospermum japonicum]|uniref:DUF7870 domain-containing protein n=1 Tax=Phtheirospermum japonicum TaxID=374723 RepID=A0A830BMM2_9LAMI|nr:hypothetical protein PHJA_000823700 [Phtheirospermum japonicum]
MGIGLNSHSPTLLIIKLPDSRALRIISRSLLLAIVLLALPSIGSIIGASPDATPNSGSGVSGGFKILPIVFRDLIDEGLVKKNHKGFVHGPGPKDVEADLMFLRDAGIDLLTGANLNQNNAGAHQVFDFVFIPNFHGIRKINGLVKDGGLVVSPLGADPLDELRLLMNFKIVYLRRFENTVIAMRKVSSDVASPYSNRVSCGFTPEKKKAALKGLEDVYLEPPRKKKSSFTSRKIKYLPDLLKDSLDGYARRVFVSDDSRALDWFYKNYPMRDQEFEVYRMSSGEEKTESDWMRKNVGPEDYVVMKAEARVVEEMLRDNALCLVDELFLECRNQWEDGEEEEEENGSKRAYWECLALYGKVRDEGIAVHQWWY